MYFHDSWIRTTEKKNHVFCDASEVAISAVAYVENQGQYGFILGKSKLTPLHGHSIPRLELFGAVLAVEFAQSVSEQLEISIEHFKFYCDSKVVLGYISNHSRRFYQYVSNRVMKIRKVTKSEQWFYIPSERNPADEATRPIHASALQHSKWLEGPEQSELYPRSQEKILYELIDPESDKEIKQEVRCLKTNTSDFVIGDSLARISEWPKVVKYVARLRHLANPFKHDEKDSDSKCFGWHDCRI